MNLQISPGLAKSQVFKFAILALAVLSPAWGQSTGTLLGTVKDSSNVPVVDALVSLFGPGMTTPARSTRTDATGYFSFASLPPNTYRMTVEKSGLAPSEEKDVSVQNAQTAQLNPVMSEKLTTVETRREVPVQMSNAEVAQSLTTAQLDQLPIQQDDPLQLIRTQAGVAVGGPTSTTYVALEKLYGNTPPFTTIDGLRASLSNVTVDGINVQDNTARYNGLDFLPNNLRLDQVSQFTLVTANQGSEYGNGATQTAFVTPSGTNVLHGSAFYINSNNALNANDWLQNSQGLKDAFKTNQGGFEVGGPLLKNKLFGYGAYQFLRGNNTIGISSPTLPYGGMSLIDSGTDPTVAKVLALIPAPNAGSQYVHGEGLPQTFDNATARLDYLPRAKDSIVASFLWNRENFGVSPSAYESTFAVVEHSKASFASIAWRHAVSARLTNEVRAGFNIASAATINEERQQVTPAYNLNFSSISQFASLPPPISNAGNAGTAPKTYVFQDNATYTARTHSLQFGFQSQINRNSIYSESGSVPTVTLCGVVTEVCQTAGLDGGYSLVAENFYPLDATGKLGVTPQRSAPGLENYAPYFQDVWRVMPNLTITLGLRYDYYTAVTDRSGLSYIGKLYGGTVLTTAQQPYCTSQNCVPGVEYNLPQGSPYYTPDKRTFGPSVGLAFDPTGNGKTAFRVAYGIAYANDDLMAAVQTPVAANAAGTYSYNSIHTAPGATLAQGVQLPSIPTTSYTCGSTQMLAQPIPYGGTCFVGGITQAFPNEIEAYGVIDSDLRTPYVQQWSAGFQQEWGGMLFDLRYVGNHAVHLVRPDLFNYVSDPQSPSVWDSVIYLSNTSGSTYNGLQFDVRHRLRKGLQFQANYTFSKTLTDSNTFNSAFVDQYRSPTDYGLDRGPAQFDIKNAFKANITYDLPFGRGRFQGLFGGWNVSAIAIAQSGLPFSIVTCSPTSCDQNNSIFTQTADVVAGTNLSQIISYKMTTAGPSVAPSVNSNNIGQIFVVPPYGAPGDLQPRSFFGPSTFDLDLAIQKRFRITESQSIEVRGEALNSLNHPSFGFNNQNICQQQPDGTCTLGVGTGLSAFGHSAYSVNLPRTVQLSAYYRF